MDELNQNTENTSVEVIEPVSIETVEKKKDRKTKVKCVAAGAVGGIAAFILGRKIFKALKQARADKAARKAAVAQEATQSDED